MTSVRRHSLIVGVLLVGSAGLAATACGGSDEPEGDPLPAEVGAILAASAQAMGDVTSVRFTLARSGAPVYIDTFESLALDGVDGRFAAPASADAVLTVEVDGSLKTKLGAVAIDDEVWLSNPVTGDLRTAAGRLRHRPVEVLRSRERVAAAARRAAGRRAGR